MKQICWNCRKETGSTFLSVFLVHHAISIKVSLVKFSKTCELIEIKIKTNKTAIINMFKVNEII